MNFADTVGSLRGPDGVFRDDRPIRIARAPGRLDLMGGNVDYTGGWVFESTIREATWAAVQLRDDDTILLLNPQMREHGWRDSVAFRLSDLTSETAVRQLVSGDPAIRWTAYVLGIFYLLRQRHADVASGATVYIASDVPLNKGVSSSAAVEVAVMKAAAAAYGFPMDGVALAESCQWVENTIAQSPCGIMDQAAVVLGDPGYVLPLLCQPCSPAPLVRLPAEVECRAIDSGVMHEVSGLQCETARAAAFMGYKLICDWEELPVVLDESGRIPRWKDTRWNGYLSNLSPSLFRSRYEARLPEQLSGADYLREGQLHVDPFTPVRAEVMYPVRGAARYAVEENHRIRTFIELARGSAFELMGELMYQSHAAYTECGLGCAATDRIVDLVREEAGAGLYGAKVTGAGAGGTVAVLGRRDAGEAFEHVVRRYAEFTGCMPYVFEGSSEGADRFGVRTL
jgi:galactokinase